MKYRESIQYILSADRFGKVPTLSRIRTLLSRLGNPQDRIRCIHVTGTNGKGSVCAMLASVLRAAGYRVGLFTSPDILEFRNRIRLDGEMISETAFADVVTEVRQAANSLESPPLQFELITAAAFLFFCRQAPDFVVVEVGLGGRMDPTNVILQPLLSVITNVDFDHTAVLGDTLQQIASEKAGIIKQGRPILYGGSNPEVLSVLHSVAGEKGATLDLAQAVPVIVRSMTLSGTVLDYGAEKDLQISLLGTYQPANAQTALRAVDILRREGITVSRDAVRRGLRDVRWQARFELLAKDPVLLYDGGHNPDGVRVAVQSVKTYFPGVRVNLLSGVMADKDYREMVRLLEPVTNRVFAVTLPDGRALDATKYADCFADLHIEATAHRSVEEALSDAVAVSRRTGVPLICLGSLHLYRKVREALPTALQNHG